MPVHENAGGEILGGQEHGYRFSRVWLTSFLAWIYGSDSSWS